MKTLTELSSEFFDSVELRVTKSAEETESDRICFKKSLEQFLASGAKEDAFIVYFCFSEIFKLFGKGYENTQKLLETLSDHEYHSGELLSKHRDHYSHSVYVFALGLAVYANDRTFRNAFNAFYSLSDDGKAYEKFLYLWGMTALFHDVGYPFQLAHEQIKNYSEDLWGNGNSANPFVSFGNFAGFTAIDGNSAKTLAQGLNCNRQFENLDQLFAYGLKLREGYDEEEVCAKLRKRVEIQPAFMDHGYFSAVIIAKQLIRTSDFTFDVSKLDVLTAILLHNNFNKYDAPDAHPIKLNEHPLSYLLILCDELQSWDRLAYGKASKRDPIAWDVALDVKDNSVTGEYYFESCSVTDAEGGKRMNKLFAEIQDGEFTRKIHKFLNTDLKINAKADEKPKKKRANLYASDNSFINLCDFAKAIHASYLEHCTDMDADSINTDFANLPLEFKVSNIQQAKSYAYKLELINCFYSGKDLDYPVVNNFATDGVGAYGSDNLGFLCREEHVRWVKEKLSFGWKYGVEGKDYKNKDERNAKKVHADIVPFEKLTPQEQKKDELMINNIIPLLRKFGNNIRIYSYRTGRKPDLEIAGTGHRFFTDDRAKLKEKIKAVLLKYSENYRVIVRTCFAYGADQLIAECANELGIATKAAIPDEYEKYIENVRDDCNKNGVHFGKDEELNLRHLLAQTVVCKTVKNPDFYYLGASRYIIEHCKKLIVLWDGKETPLYDEADGGKFINRGGTFDCIRIAKERGLKENEDIHIIRCHR